MYIRTDDRPRKDGEDPVGRIGLAPGYEAAQARGFGVSIAKRALTAGMRPMINMGRRIAQLVLAQVDAELSLDEPRADILRKLVTEMTRRAVRAKDLWQAFSRLCAPGGGPGPALA